MSPLPQQLIDRWENRADISPGQGMIYWHVLLGGNSQVHDLARGAQERMARFPDLHMTPLEWLHMTVLIAGPEHEITVGETQQMLSRAASLLAQIAPIKISLGRLLYHAEAIALQAQPASAMAPLLRVTQTATRRATDRKTDPDKSASSWIPHVTLCYSTGRQPTAPIIAALGTRLPSCDITIEAVDLVIQQGPERLWDWHSVGTVRLGAGRSPRSGRPAVL